MSEKKLDLIAQLLAKAERTTPEEAQALTEHAERLSRQTPVCPATDEGWICTLAKVAVAGVAVAIVGGAVLLLTGCAPTATPEDEFVRDVRTVASANGYPWSDELEAEALTLGQAVCRDLDAGRPLDAIRDEVIAQAETPQAGRVILAAVDSAPKTLCEDR